LPQAGAAFFTYLFMNTKPNPKAAKTQITANTFRKPVKLRLCQSVLRFFFTLEVPCEKLKYQKSNCFVENTVFVITSKPEGESRNLLF
jgi:hypothetical protein